MTLAETEAGNDSILVLVADDDEAVRTSVARFLGDYGFTVLQAVNSGAALRVVAEHTLDAAVIARRMKPNDGFEIARQIQVKGDRTGIVMLSDDAGTDLLMQAGRYGIGQVMKLPVDPERLVEMVKRAVRARGRNPDRRMKDAAPGLSPDALMARAIALAGQNAEAGMGGPFGAVVADAEGHILGEGVNSVYTRCDPSAQAEIVAIRRAAEKRNSPRLDGCAIYCSTEPAMMGQALIIGTGIEKVFYGISHSEAGTPGGGEDGLLEAIARPLDRRTVPHEQKNRAEALVVFEAWKKSRAAKA